MHQDEVISRRGRVARRLLLAVGLAGIVGLGCATITLAPPTDERAAKQFLPAAEQGDPVAQYQVGLSYRYGTSGLPRDPAKAVSWLRKAATAGNADAQFALGDLYLNGNEGLAADPAQALSWFHQAAAKNSGNQLWLADLLEKGRPGVLPADPAAARALYVQAAPRSRLACQRLGQMAERGSGGESGPLAALKWYVLADSAVDIARQEKMLKPAEVARARAEAAGWQR